MKPLQTSRGITKVEYTFVIWMIGMLLFFLHISLQAQVERVHEQTCQAYRQSIISQMQLDSITQTNDLTIKNNTLSLKQSIDTSCPKQGTYQMTAQQPNTYEIICSYHKTTNESWFNKLMRLITK